MVYADPQKARAYSRAYAGLPSTKERKRQQYLARREEILARQRKWQRDHPDLLTTQVARRRARKFGASGSHTHREWQEKVRLLGGCCIYCGEAKPLGRDHKVPLIRGGSDDISNIVPACNHCNVTKATRTAQEYISGFAILVLAAAVFVP